MCRQGHYNLCPERKGFGYGTHGAMTSFVRVPERCLHRIPETLPLQHAALTEPCCVAYQAVCVNSSVAPGDLVVVPGVAFDDDGYRLGHGKGYYDRAFAAELGDAPTLVGFGYEFQIVDAVPHDHRDRQMDAIVTDRKVRDCSGCLR